MVQVAHAFDTLCRGLATRQRRQQHRSEDRDDGNDNKKFDEGEGGCVVCRAWGVIVSNGAGSAQSEIGNRKSEIHGLFALTLYRAAAAGAFTSASVSVTPLPVVTSEASVHVVELLERSSV